MEFLNIDERIELERIKSHHSTSDWDFYSSWTLDTSVYISAPSSLKLTYVTSLALLKHSVSGLITEGRIVDNIRFYRTRTTSTYPTYVFRANAADGGADYSAGYCIVLKGSDVSNDAPLNRATLCYGSRSSPTEILAQSINPALAQNTWYKLRVTWWVSAGVLMVRLEYFDGTDWVKLCSDWADTNNRYATNSIQRCGVGAAQCISPYYTWHDDTEIWVRSG
jgi:hypothetical protein